MLALLRFGRRGGGRLLGSIAALMLATAASGCTLCPPGYMDDYATIGGKWQRSDPVEGRVGSPFSDSSVMVSHSQLPGVVRPDEVIYEEGFGSDGTGFDSYEGEFEGEPLYEGGIEIVPQYETFGEDW